MKKWFGFSLGLLLAMCCRAAEFDLDYLPKDKKETSAVTQKMLTAGEEIAYGTEHEAQKLWIFRPADLKENELRPCVFFIHGGGWGGSPSGLAPQCIYLAQRGIVAVSIHFRTPSTQTGISPKDSLSDSLSAYRWVKQNGNKHNIDPDRIVVSGGSAGGHLSLAMVTLSGCDNPADDLSVPVDPKAMILFNPAFDLVEGWQGGAKKCKAHGIDPATFSPAHFVKPGLPETLILSGGKDGIISPSMINKFVDRMKKHGNTCSFVEYPDADHSFFNYGKKSNVYFRQTMAEVEKFLQKLGYMKTSAKKKSKPNIILVMTDDQGWGQTGYYNHPVLKTPNLDKMADNGLRFDRFYAGGPNCSPTRATILTGRSHTRAGVNNHGYALRIQEKTLPQALQKAGYATGHFGKWHLDGFSGPGVVVLKDDPRGPGVFGFDEWLSVTNFFDRNPLLSRKGKFEEFKGDSSEVIVEEALKFIKRHAASEKPFLSVIWYGSPHNPFSASELDKAGFSGLDKMSQGHYGELVAMDRSIGTLRKGLRDLGIADNTLVWFCSDNGGLPKIKPDTVGGLRGNKNTIFEGGLRVPAIIEWPAVIKPRITKYPSVTMDIFPTIAEVVGLDETTMLQPCDGMSIRPLFDGEIGRRVKPIPFRHTGRTAFIDNDYKLLTQRIEKGVFELYNVTEDTNETKDLFASHPEIAQRLVEQFTAWNKGVEASITGKDYPEGFVRKDEPKPQQRWSTSEQYEPYIEQFKKRPEYAGEIKKRSKGKENSQKK